MKRSLSAIPLLSSALLAQVPLPAVQKHVKIEAGVPYKYTSKLKSVVELNFTFGFSHAPGKGIIASTLDRLARSKGFTVRHIASGNGGTNSGQVPFFSLSDLVAGQVIVANNISQMGSTTLGTSRQDAIRQAIETHGRGYLAFHGSGDNTHTAWAWYTTTLHPVAYAGHGAKLDVPVYKHLAETKHIVLQGTFESKVAFATVPDELNPDGTEALAQAPVRRIQDELYRYGRDISRATGYKEKVTPLLKYDAREVPIATLPEQYQRRGGNLFSYLYKVGNGMTAFHPSGHDNADLLDPATGFDGGAGDFDRYVGQLLFFLAGYDRTACDASCNGLDIVDAQNRRTGSVHGTLRGESLQEETTGIDGRQASLGIQFAEGRMAFTSTLDQPFRAVLLDVAGKMVDEKAGSGLAYLEFAKAGLEEGIYFLSVRSGKGAARTKRYVLTQD